MCGLYFNFFQDSDGVQLVDAPAALVTVISEDTNNPVHYQLDQVIVVIENEIGVTLSRFVDAFLITFSLIYSLYLS